ncbi:hypothetical protein [Actinomycetospora cinnamomea]|nr:hypothetical protein [Actinomycetospora cinnamomea]
MAVTSDDARAQGERDARARAGSEPDGAPDDATLTVFQTAAWIPPAYREAYLEGAASVLKRASVGE